MRKSIVSGLLIIVALSLAIRAAQKRENALLQNYISFSVTAPPAALGLDPFYKKYADAHGIPIVSSEKVPDEAVLMARDIVQFMLSERPDLRRELMRKKWKVAIMAETEKTYDIPEHRKYRLLPKIDDERLTPQQRENYHKPGGVGTMTGEQYWNMRGRGFGGEPDGENTTSCAEENLLGYPGTRYFGQSLLVHEFSHGIMRGAIYTVDPEYRKAVEDAYAAAKKQGLRSAQGYSGNNLNEYWAGGIEAYTYSNGQTREWLLETDPRLYELVRQVIPAQKMPGNIYVGRARQPRTSMSSVSPDKITTAQFKDLMQTVAAGWNEGNAKKAADCYTEDALYTEPPDKQVYVGRKALYEFFGGDKKPEPPMRMTWHHLAFDEAAQIGFGEYTFQMNNRYHGIVVVKIRDGKISNWREYQYKSDLEWKEFIKKNDF